MKGKLHLILIAIVAMFLLSGCITEGEWSEYLGGRKMEIDWFSTGGILLLIGAISNPVIMRLLQMFNGDNEPIEDNGGTLYYYFFFCLTLMTIVFFGWNLYTENTDGIYKPVILALGLGVLIVRWGCDKNYLAIHTISIIGSAVSFMLGIFCFIYGENLGGDLYHGKVFYWVWIAILALTAIGVCILGDKQITKKQKTKVAPQQKKEKPSKDDNNGWAEVFICEGHNVGYKFSHGRSIVQIFEVNGEVIGEYFTRQVDGCYVAFIELENDITRVYMIYPEENRFIMGNRWTSNEEIIDDSLIEGYLTKIK